MKVNFILFWMDIIIVHCHCPLVQERTTTENKTWNKNGEEKEQKTWNKNGEETENRKHEIRMEKKQKIENMK